MKIAHLAAILTGLVVGLAGMAQGQSFPSKTIRIVVPFAPGASADILGRVIAESMAKGLGQSVIVENRPGAGAVVGYELVARAPADGHTILQVWPSFVINPGIRSGLSYHPINDFKAVGQAISLPMAIAVHPSVPAKSLKELIALARDKPGELTYGHIGAGTIHHLVGEMVCNVNDWRCPERTRALKLFLHNPSAFIYG